MQPGARLCDRLHRFTAALLVALYAFLATVGTSLVICHEEGGHAAIEWRGASCCVDEPSREARIDRAPVASRSGTAEDCGACRDLPMTTLLTSRSAETVRAPSVPSPDEMPAPVVATGDLVSWMRAAFAPPVRPLASPGAPPPRTAIRSVVLRC